MDKLAPASIARAVRRLSANQDDIRQEIEERRLPPNDYFQQVYRAQHPEVEELEARQAQHSQRTFIEGIKDTLSPAGAVIGEAIRRLSHTEPDLRSTLPQNEYLLQIHEAAIAEQNRRLAENRTTSSDEDETDVNKLNIVTGLRDRIGEVVRRLSTYDEDERNKLSTRELFNFFQQTNRKPRGGGRSSSCESDRRPGFHKSSSSGVFPKKKKKKRNWRELLKLLKKQVDHGECYIQFFCILYSLSL